MRVRITSWIVLLLLSTLILGACGDGDAGVAASDMLPPISADEYDIIHNDSLEETFQEALVGLGVWEEIAGRTDVVSRITSIDGLMDCAEDTGSMSVRFYNNKEFRYVAGTAVVVNFDRLTSWETAAACFEELMMPGIGVSADNPELRPCTNWWEYEDGEATYYMFFAGTSPLICEQMCEGMQGCPGPNVSF